MISICTFALASLDSGQKVGHAPIVILNLGLPILSGDGDSGFPPQILALENLKFLSLEYQGFTFLPDEIQTLKSLETLELSKCPYLTSLGNQLGLCPLQS